MPSLETLEISKYDFQIGLSGTGPGQPSQFSCQGQREKYWSLAILETNLLAPSPVLCFTPQVTFLLQ